MAESCFCRRRFYKIWAYMPEILATNADRSSSDAGLGQAKDGHNVSKLGWGMTWVLPKR